jgi:YVTN family beta-propeller protein
MYIAAFGTDRVAQVDTNGNVLWFVEVSPPSGSGSNVDPKNKRGPRGLALNAAAQTLYSLNRISDTISIINTATPAVTSEIVVGTDPTPSTVKAGRGFLYDGKLSGNGTGSCASCHVDGDMDHLAWNLGDPEGSMTSTVQKGQTFQYHPMKGPLTTQTLRGLLDLSPYHWRGDKPNFAAFNAAFVSLLGGSQISDADMTIYTNFAHSILFQPNPNRESGSHSADILEQRQSRQRRDRFHDSGPDGPRPQTCNDCHTANPGTGSDRLIKPDQPQPLKVPQLRNVYQKLLYDKTRRRTSMASD